MTSAKLFMMGEERELLGTYMDYYKHTDAKGAPTSDLEGGFLKLSFVSQESDAIFWHHLTKALDDETERMEKGEIHFYSKGEDDLAIRKYKFRDAFIVAYSEEFNVDNTENMVTFLTISPAIQNYGFTHDFVKYWQVSWLPPAEPNYYQPKEEPEDRIIYINGHFYNKDGTFEGKVNEADFEGSVEDVYVCDGKSTRKDKNGNDFFTYNGTELLKENSVKITNKEFLKFVGIAYAESSVGNGVEIKNEVYAIASAMVNYRQLTGKKSLAYAATDGNIMFSKFKKAIDEERNNSFMQTAIAGGINALKGGKDYSSKGTHWAGNDIGSKFEKWHDGLIFTDCDHDIFMLGDNAVSGKHYITYKNGKAPTLRGKWDYKWETTAAYSGRNSKGKLSGTTFMKVSEKFKIATGNNGQ